MSIALGIIGSGTIGTFHAEVAAKTGATVVAFCDVDGKKAEEAAAKHDGAKVTTSVDDLLKMKDIDAVVVSVPNFVHREMAIRALEAGKDVLLEKPMAMNVAECDEILAAKAKTDRLVQMGFVCRCAPMAVAVRTLIDAGRFGNLYHAKVTWFRRRGIPGLGGWFTNKAQSGGGVLIDLGVHMIDLAMHMADRPRARRVSGITTSRFGSPIDQYRYTEMFAGPPRLDGTFDVEDGATALVRFDNDFTMEMTVTWAANVPEDLFPSGVILMGDKAGCFFDLWTGKFIIADQQDGQLVDIKPLLEPGDPWEQAWCEQHRRFAKAVDLREQPGATPEQGRDVQAILDALYRSADEGREVEV